MEKDISFSNNSYDYGFRIYNSSIAKFLSVDPLTKDYPMLTPYQFASNRPIDGIDVDGLEYMRYRSWSDGSERGGVFASFANLTANTVAGAVNGVANTVMGMKAAGVYVYQAAHGG